jgi:hypothetical protein
MAARWQSDQERHRTCTGKVQHKTREEAEAVSERQRTKWKLTEPVILNVYLCPFCRQFHIGRNYQK